MQDAAIKSRCHDRDLRSVVYAGFKANLGDIRSSRLNGIAWSKIVENLNSKGVSGATIHRLLAWVRTSRHGAWGLDVGQPVWVIKVGEGKGRKSANKRASNAPDVMPLQPPSEAGAAFLPGVPEHYDGDQFDLAEKAAEMTDDELRERYPHYSRAFWEPIRATVYTYTLERKLKAAIAREMAKRGITGVALDLEDASAEAH